MQELEKIMNILRNHMDAGWIPVDERLPDESLNSVIGWDELRERCCFVQYYGGKWILGNREPVNIIAWRPLPEPYRPERSEKCPKGLEHLSIEEGCRKCWEREMPEEKNPSWIEKMLRKFDRRE